MRHLLEEALPVAFAESPVAVYSGDPHTVAADFFGDLQLQSTISFDNRTPLLPRTSQPLVIGLVDHYRFSQECLARALQDLNPDDTITQFMTVQDCVAADCADLDVIIYYPHEHDTAQCTTLSNVATIRSAYPAVPLVVLSDADDTQQPASKRSILDSGANVFVPTRSDDIFITIGAIRFVKEGGIITPLEPSVPTRCVNVVGMERQRRLTSREMAVLDHLQRGKANKIIAHALSLSENTVKIHVRNIMRKMGATNRTQAVDAARTLRNSVERQAVADAFPAPNWCRRKSEADRRAGVREKGHRYAGQVRPI